MKILGILFVMFFFICFSYLVKKTSKWERGLSTIYIFGVGAFTYVVFIPFIMLMQSKISYRVDALVTVYITQPQQLMIIFMGTVSVFVFYAALRLSNFFTKSVVIVRAKVPMQPQMKKNILYFLLANILLWFFLLIFYSKQLGVMGNYHEAYGITYTHPLMSQLTMGINVTLAILTALFLRTRGFIYTLCGIAVFILNASFGILLSSKLPILISILGLISGTIGYVRISTRLAVLLAIVGIPFLFSLILIYSYYRAEGAPTVQDIPKILENANITRLDPAGPLSSLGYYMNNSSLDLGGSYINELSLFVPRAIWPDRPSSLAEEYARNVLPNWKPGQGVGYSPFAEAYQNFSFFGVFVQFFLYGIIWSLIWLFFRYWFCKHEPLIFSVVYQIVGYLTLIMGFRMSLMGNIKMLLMYLLPVIIVLFIKKTRFSKLPIRI